jgi:hypothetical protein
MIAEKHLHREDLVGKVIDAHSHIGIALREAAQINFPYCSSAEDLAYRRKANGVDFAVVFPISPAFYYDLPTIVETGDLRPAARPISRVPYERENRLLLTDVYQFCPEHSRQFLPFISVDPGRLIDEQIASLEELEQEFPIYGVKIHPLMVQSKALALLDVGAPLLAFFAARNWPVLVIAHIGRAYCPEDVGDAFEVLKAARRMHFDFCANTSAYAMEHLPRAVGPRRVLFGSDMPVVRIRMRRICERGFYINLVPRGLYGDVSDDPHMREVGDEEGAQLSFFLYEELLAFRQAAEAVGLNAEDVADVMYNNATRLIAAAGGEIAWVHSKSVTGASLRQAQGKL